MTRPVHPGDTLRDEGARHARQVSQLPLGDHVLIRDYEVTGGFADIPHKLGRRYVGAMEIGRAHV